MKNRFLSVVNRNQELGKRMSRQSAKWTCRHCTYENWPKALRCTICLNPRPTHYIEEEAPTEERDIYKIAPLVQEQEPDPPPPPTPPTCNPYNKWTCSKCTYLNWPRAVKCIQCLSPRNRTSPTSPVSPPPEPTTSAEATQNDNSGKKWYSSVKWTCFSCTYENWPKSKRCVMCGTFRPKSDPSVNNQTTEAEDHHNRYYSPNSPSLCSESSFRISGNICPEPADIELQLSSASNGATSLPTNNYLRSLRRKAREADWLWLNACTAVVEGDSEPVMRYLSSNGDLARQLTHAEVSLLGQPSVFDSGYTLVHLAIKYQRDDILNMLLSHSGVQHPVAKRVPSDVCNDIAADIRRHINASFKQRKGDFSCYFVTEFVTFALPTEIEQFHPSVQKVLFDELLDRDVQKELEEDAPIINWSLELTERLGSRLYALWNRSAGDCLLDSALQATWGVFDRDNTLRRVLGDSLCEAASVLYPRWKEAETLQANMMHFSLDEAQWQEDWAMLVSLATQPGSALEQMHIFTLAHILRRPIIVYGVKYVKSFRGEALGYARFEGIYIPLLWEPSFCWKSPIALGYTRGHFSALVSMEPEPEVIPGAGANPRNTDDLQVVFLPLMTADRQLLPLHYLTQSELGREEEIIRQWLDCCVTEGGILVAQQKVPRKPHLVLQMIEEWLDIYRNLSHHRLSETITQVYSSDGDSDQE